MENILTINGGSSSIKFALFQTAPVLQRVLQGEVERIGLAGTSLTFSEPPLTSTHSASIAAENFHAAANALLDWLASKFSIDSVSAVGHRVVHGMHHLQHELVTPDLLAELHGIAPYDPEHLPGEIELMEIFRQRYPQLPQIACFDTTFHHNMPRVAKLLPIPHRYADMGIQRYGFHGLSYEYLLQELENIAGSETARGRVIIAHLGNGSSLTAIHEGRSLDTSMGFTPGSGVMMGSRTGDLDPGVALYLMQHEHMTSEQFSRMVNHESGLLGVSGCSSDMRDLLARELQDTRAAEAIELYCYQIKKYIGACAAVLGGLDTLVFSGGIGEHAATIRARICKGLEFLGIHIDLTSNAKNMSVISTVASKVTVRVIHTDEELMIAQSVIHLLA